MNRFRRNPANALAKKYMVTALIQLLKEKPMSAITISELTQKAGVSRMTFYRNYQTKEDIFTSYFSDLVDNYIEEAKNLELKGSYYDTGRLIHCFSYFQKYDSFLESLFRSDLSYIFLRGISSYMTETWKKPEDSIEDFYTLQAFTGSLYNLYISWVLNGKKETPEQMAGILHRIYGK